MNEQFSFVFNSNSTILFVGGYRSIKVLKFKNGEKLLQTLTTPQRIIYSLIFMNKSNLLVSGGESDQILLWSQGKNGCWEPYQIIQGGDECNIKFMIVNEDEDLLILYAAKFCIISLWKKVNTSWMLCQYIPKMRGVVSFSLNKSQTELFLCCLDYNIIILEIREDFHGSMKYIKTNCYGYQSCWISDSEFAFQGKQEFLEIYSLDLIDQKLYDCVLVKQDYFDLDNFLFKYEDFKIKEKIKVQNTQQGLPSFPCKYLESNGILIVQNGNFLNFFGTFNGEIYGPWQSIEFSGQNIQGNISNDGKFLVTLDRKRNNSMQIKRLEYLG